MGGVVSLCFPRAKEPEVVVRKYNQSTNEWEYDVKSPIRDKRRVSIQPSIDKIEEEGFQKTNSTTLKPIQKSRKKSGRRSPMKNGEVELQSSEYMTASKFTLYQTKRRQSIESSGLPSVLDFCTCDLPRHGSFSCSLHSKRGSFHKDQPDPYYS